MLTIQKAHPILVTLLKVQRKHGKNYSWPSQLKIMELMDIRQGLRKSRATLNRWLAKAQEEKYIIRRRRIKRDPMYGIIFKSTLYKITIKGYRMLSMFGVDMSKEIAQYQKWLEEINPEHEANQTRKLLETAKKNPRHEEFMAGIYESLEKRHVIA